MAEVRIGEEEESHRRAGRGGRELLRRGSVEFTQPRDGGPETGVVTGRAAAGAVGLDGAEALLEDIYCIDLELLVE